MGLDKQSDRGADSEHLNIQRYFEHVYDDTPGDVIYEASVEAVAPKASTIVIGGGASAFIDQTDRTFSRGEVLSRYRREREALRRIGSVTVRLGVVENES
ncbi:hypothetical protein [Mycolicibacterium sphagni]|uniref:hypothetical protein n=1 Tax=Mycolicibacterium sphagni TaxID=1786 RepID=UPI001055C587|nr:hypothetical protein [Mycolicibacterium sphagni]